MRYGSLPIVRLTGGLADTVVDCDDRTMRDGTANGFAFEAVTADEMLACLDRALAVYGQPVSWRRTQRRAMEGFHGWEAAARRYIEIYRRPAPNAPLESAAGEQKIALPAEIRA